LSVKVECRQACSVSLSAGPPKQGKQLKGCRTSPHTQSYLRSVTGQCVTTQLHPSSPATGLTCHSLQELESILLHPDMDRHFGVSLNCIELADSHLEIVQEVIADPQGTMAVLDEAMRLAQEQVVMAQQDSNENMAIKVRIANSRSLRTPPCHHTPPSMCRAWCTPACMGCHTTWTPRAQISAQHPAV
jgi:hypothetical protein